MDPILSLIIILTSAFILGEFINFFRLPRVLGYILGGFLVAHLGLTDPGNIIEFLKDLGIVFLFFFVGLEINMRSMKKKITRSASLGLWTTMTSFSAGTLVSFAAGFDLFTSFIVGVCTSVSAQAVVAMVLDETGMLKKRLGQDIINAGVVADILQLAGIGVLFSFLPIVAKVSLSQLLFNWIIFVGVIFLVKLLLFPLFSWVLTKEKESRITFFFGGIIIASLMAYLADVLGIGSILGALFAGAAIRYFFDDIIVNALARDFRLIGFGFFIPVLFVWTGHEAFTLGISQNIFMGLLLAAAAIIGNLIGANIALKKLPLHQRAMGGIGLAAKGDVEIVLAAILLDAAIISSGVYSMIIIMSVTTMVISPALFYIIEERYRVKNKKTWKNKKTKKQSKKR